MPFDTLRFDELSTDDQLRSALPLMLLLRPSLSPETFLDDVRALEPDGYRLIAGYDADGRMVTLAGVRPARSLGRGPHAYVNDLITHPDHRNRGYATALLRHLAAHALANDLPKLYLNSYTIAEPFYDKLGFHSLDARPRWIECAALSRSRPDPV
jgi:GNAT superfamily N-acetyltransferase